MAPFYFIVFPAKSRTSTTLVIRPFVWGWGDGIGEPFFFVCDAEGNPDMYLCSGNLFLKFE